MNYAIARHKKIKNSLPMGILKGRGGSSPLKSQERIYSARRDKIIGFTLVEILVVLFIISIVTSVALLSISHNENKKLEAFANEVTQHLTLAEEQAMLQPSILGLSFSNQSYQFASFQSINEKKKAWVLLDDSVLGKHKIPNNIQVDVKAANVSSDDDENKDDDEEQDAFIPQIIISTNGDVTPFNIYIGKAGDRPKYVIIGDADGSITNKALF